MSDVISLYQASLWLPDDHRPEDPYTIAGSVTLEPMFRVSINGIRLTKPLTLKQITQLEDWQQNAGTFGRVLSKLTRLNVTAYRVTSSNGDL